MSTIQRIVPIAGGLLLAVSGTAFADRVQLANGDIVSGNLIEKTIDSVVIKTVYAGEIKIKRSKVVSITTDGPHRVLLHDGQQVDGMLVIDEKGELLLQTPDQSTPVVGGLDAIASITAIPSDEPPQYKWRGNVTVAGEVKTGNTQTDKFNADARTVAEKKGIDRYTFSAGLIREESENSLTTEQYRLGGKYDRFFMKQWYGYVGAAFEQDKFKDIDLRSIVSAGSGYQFYDEDELRVALEGGLSYTDENYVIEEDSSYAGFNWGFNWEQTFFDKHLNFFHRHRGNQGFDESDNLIINANTGVRIPIASGISATAQYDLDWDRSPPDDAESTDHTYSFGVGYDW